MFLVKKKIIRIKTEKEKNKVVKIEIPGINTSKCVRDKL